MACPDSARSTWCYRMCPLVAQKCIYKNISPQILEMYSFTRFYLYMYLVRRSSGPLVLGRNSIIDWMPFLLVGEGVHP